MGSEPFDETILQSNRGTVFVRGGWSRDEVLIGVSEQRSDTDPDVIVSLSRDQAKRVITALREMLPKRQAWLVCPDCGHQPHEDGCCAGATDRDEPENGRHCACVTNSMPREVRSHAPRDHK